MKKFIIAVVLRNNKVLYFSQASHSRNDATWVIKEMSEILWGNNVISVKCVDKKGGQA